MPVVPLPALSKISSDLRRAAPIAAVTTFLLPVTGCFIPNLPSLLMLAKAARCAFLGSDLKDFLAIFKSFVKVIRPVESRPNEDGLQGKN